MIHYHGIAGTEIKVIAKVFSGRHVFVSYENPQMLENVSSICSSFALDNGAFSAWRQGKPYDFDGYLEWVKRFYRHPAYHFHLIPDIIDGDEKKNREMVEKWPLDGVPVWHMHESIDWLVELCSSFKRVALGSSGQYACVGLPGWWQRMNEAMTAICVDGQPPCKLHGLRMLRIEVFSRIPLNSADSTTAVRDIKYDKRWIGYNAPTNRYMRSLVVADRLESFQSSATWTSQPIQRGLF